MTRDYKPRSIPPKRKSFGSTLIGVFVGVVIGVLISAGVVWYLNRTPQPFQNKGKPAPERNGEAKGGEAVRPEASVSSAPLPGKPGDKVAERPRFEFYKILPGVQEPAPQPVAKGETKAEPAKPDLLYLQVGAFQNPADADNLKARLALMGLEASVRPVTVPEKGVMHRVRIGPFRSPEDMSKVRSLMAQNEIQASLVRVKDGTD